MDAKQTALNFIKNVLKDSGGEITAYSDDGIRASVTYKKDDGTELTINLTKPVKKDKTGIWVADFDKYSSMKIDLERYPIDYNIETAAKDGMAVFVDKVLPSGDRQVAFVVNKLHSGKEIIEAFFSKSSKGIPCDIFICHKSDSWIILTRIIYDGELFYGVEDNSRYSSKDEKYYCFNYRYLKVFEGNNMKSVYLLNDSDITEGELRKSILSSNTNDHIANKLLLYYES